MTGFSILQLFLISLLFCSLIMVVTWLVAQKIDNYSIVDSVWAGSFPLVAGLFLFLGAGYADRKFLMLSIVSLWGVRLAYMLGRRIQQHHPKEDGRYLELRKRYAPHVKREFLEFFLIQGVSVAFLSVPFLLMAQNPDPVLTTLEWIGFGVALVSFFGEALADAQANRFKSNPENRGKVCRDGLWRYSRHPNYFFESCIWWGYFLMALSTPYGWLTVYCPLAILYLLLKVTGIPMAEAQSLKSRGEAFREYQKTTSAFIPWFVRSSQ
jgi:steroid 5-alpha reductase family enzyme